MAIGDELPFDDYLSGKTSGSNLSAFDRVLEMTGNPLFLYLQGVITPEMLLQSVRNATSKPLDTSMADWKPFEEAAAGNTMLLTAYDMIKKGYSVGATMEALDREMVASGNTDEASTRRLGYIESDLEEFKKRWDGANEIARRVDAGELFEGDDGVVREKLDTAQAMSVLGRMGMPQLLQNPMMWDVIPDPELLAKAAVKDAEATSLLKSLAPIVDLETGMLKPREARKIQKESASTASKAYQDFLKRTPEGQSLLERVTGPRTVKTKEEKAQQQSSNIRKGLIGYALNTIGLPVALGATLYKGGKKIIGDISEGKLVNPIGSEPKPKVDQQDYWAKMAASYAGRAAQDQARKPITTLQERAKKAEADALAAMAEAKAKGTPAALQFVQQGLAPAMALTQGTGGGGRRAPRTLSDAEIDQMSNMLALGGRG